MKQKEGKKKFLKKGKNGNYNLSANVESLSCGGSLLNVSAALLILLLLLLALDDENCCW